MQGQLRIEQMYAFIIVDDDGTEGIPAFNPPDGGMAIPMVGADMAMVDKLRPIAVTMSLTFGKTVELVKFSQREHVETIGGD